MIKSYLSLILCFCALNVGFGQVTIYSESMGDTGANGTPITTHETNNAFDEIGLTYSGTGDIRDNTFSVGYPTASGSRNVMLNSTTETFIVDGLDLTLYAGATLSFGIRKSTNASDGSGVLVEYSTTGIAGPYTSLTFPLLPTGSGTAIWHYRTTSIIPNNATTIRFISTNTVQWRIDDLLFESLSTNTEVEFTTTTSSIAENGSFIDVCASITNPSASNATTVDITLDGASTAINGTDYDDGAAAAIGFPITLTFPANSSVDECLRIFVSDDVVVEGDEAIVLNLANPNGGDSAALGTDTQHIVTIIDDEAPVLADVVITEIMYDTAGTDDEWIEICNVSGSAQVLNNYSIEYDNGTLSTLFTFPASGAVIADGDCITVSLGSNGDGVYNVDCPFTPDYGIDASTNDTNNLVNSTATISLIASDGTTTIDSVTYDDADGADGNGASLHIIDTALDNSDTGTNWQEVVDGGSPGTNSLISPCSAVEPDINVEGDLGSFPDISNNDVTPSFLDNTRFSNTIIGNSQTKSFRIQNTGTVDLNVSNIQITGGPGDFTLTLPPTLPYVIAPNNLIIFDVTFAPSAAVTRTATVRITSDDPDENPFEFAIEGTGICDATTNTLTPLTGPDNTIVAITGSDLGGATTVEFGGVNLPITVISGTEIEVTIPANSVTGNITVTNDLGCISNDLFTVIDNAVGSCEGTGGTTPLELFISEVTDANTGGLTYVEIYNGTAGVINLSGYSIQLFNNGSATENGGVVNLNNLNLNSGDTYVIAVGAATACTGVSGSDGSLADQSGSSGGINFDPNSDDHIRLYNGTTHIDSWGTYLSDTWADPLGIDSEGVVFRRNENAATLPNTVFNLADWTYVDWTDCSENDYSDIGNFDFSTGVPPTVTGISSSTTSCNEVTISVTASEGFVGNNPLAYSWFFYDPANAGLGWQLITNGGIYNGADTANLVITDAASVADYQFYCEVREDDASCFTASDAVQITISTTTWDGTNWLPAVPDISTVAILNADYDTNIDGGSFSCCSLIVNPNWELRVSNSNYVEVETDVVVENNASIIVETQGSFVQNGDGTNAGTFTLNGTATSQVNKTTSPLANWYNYTYWSSPVQNADVDVALGFSAPDRRFYFDANNFNSTIVPDIDDEGDDWTLATGTGIMIPGRGYAATHSPIGFVSGNQYQYNFVGPLNTGDISYPIVNDPINTNHWNFIGNPYPSAIRVRGNDGLFNGNSGVIDQVVYLWSHSSPPLLTNPGNQNLNFNTSDYATINATMSVPGSSGITPGNYIPSGQSFFVRSLSNGDVVFTNSMRIVGDNNNDLFFRHPSENSSNEKETLRINLTTEEGIFSALGVAYAASATDTFDGMAYDTKRNLTSGYPVSIYSRITEEDYNLVIQSKQLNSLGETEIIPLGLRISIDELLIYKLSLGDLEGEFLSENPIYLKDKLLNTIHNLKDSDYTFTSEAGEFNDRFEIVFQDNALSTNEFDIKPNDLKIVELGNGLVEFSIAKNNTIKEVVILDVIGREIYRLPGSSSVEVYNLETLSKAAYIAQVELSNGQIITKKAIKRN